MKPFPKPEDGYSIVAMAWGLVELEPEVRDWLEGLPTANFFTVAFYIDLLAEQGPLLGEPYTRAVGWEVTGAAFAPEPSGGADQLLDRPWSTDRVVDGVHEKQPSRAT